MQQLLAGVTFYRRVIEDKNWSVGSVLLWRGSESERIPLPERGKTTGAHIRPACVDTPLLSSAVTSLLLRQKCICRESNNLEYGTVVSDW